MPGITHEQLLAELEQVQSKLQRLEAERDLLRRLLNAAQPEGPVVRPSPPVVTRPALFVNSEKTASASQQIRELLAQKPGLTKKQITDQLAGVDRERRRVIYDTAHSLARRKKLIMDEKGGLSLPAA